jgi:hypothetical protein
MITFFKKRQRKKEIISFLKDPNYYKKEFPFPCTNEKEIINGNFKLFKLIFIEALQVTENYKILKSNNYANEHVRSRNIIVSYDIQDRYYLQKNEEIFLSKDVNFMGINILNLWYSSLNIYQYCFNNEIFYSIMVLFSQNSHDNNFKKAEKNTFHFLVRKKDLPNFFDFIFPMMFEWKNNKFKIKNSIEHF